MLQRSLEYWQRLVSSNQTLPLLLTPRTNQYISHKPTPKQTAFLWLNCEDAFYGGAAGGGKSDALLMAALQYVDVPKYAALILRDSYANLSKPGALIDRAFQWLSDTDAKWDEKTKTWRFPSGATLTFGYLASPKDHLNYKSSEFQFIGIDEATDLRWIQIIYMFSRLRRLREHNVPLRFRLASNPGGISHEDIKRKYIDPVSRENGVVFISAKLKDNPYLDQTSYVRSLMHLDPVSRERLLNGDWTVREAGNTFQRHWFKIIDKSKAPIAIHRVRYWDLAATQPKREGDEPAWTVGLRMYKDENNNCYIDSIVRKRETPLAVQKIVRQCADTDGVETLIYMEQEPGSGGVNTIDHYRRNILPGFSFTAEKVTVNKKERANPLSSYAEAGNVFIINGPWVEAFLDELEIFPEGKFKDQVDSASGAFRVLFGGTMEPRVRLL